MVMGITPPICTGTYALGVSSGTVSCLDFPPHSRFGQREFGIDIVGQPIVSSFADVIWSWNILPQEAYHWIYDQWEMFMSGSANPVWFRTLNEKGTPNFEYGLYKGFMHRPECNVDAFINRTNVTIRFTRVEKME